MKLRPIDVLLLAGLAVCVSPLCAQAAPEATKILVGAGKTFLLDAPVDIDRVSIAAPEVAEVVVANMRTVMINGKAPGETSAVIWLSDGTRKEYEVDVAFAASRMEAAKLQIQKEFGDGVELTGDLTAVYVTGTVKNMFASQRAQAIAATVGKVVNLLKVEIPPQEQEILLRVKFADVDRSKSMSLGANILGIPGGYPFNVTTGAGSPSRLTSVSPPSLTSPGSLTLSDAMNILMFDPHANILTTIQALQSTNILQILAEPNLLAMNGHLATFVAGGEFPYPTLQGGGSGVGQVTIQFREFGIKLKFIPTITPRGTIRLHVAPEVSSLDYADALTIEGSTVPALTTRKVETEVELEDGQSFAIAGLLDQQTTETLSRIPGLADLPILGKLFTSKSITKNNSELLVIVTPELVAPIPKGETMAELPRPEKFLDGPGVPTTAPRTPGPDKTGPPPARPARTEMPVQELEKIQRDEQAQTQQTLSGSPASTTAAPQGSTQGSTPGSIPGSMPSLAIPMPGTTP